MPFFLDRVDAAPVKNELPYELNQWLSVTVDTLNEDINDIQDAFNNFQVPSYTSLQIADLTLTNGVILYDSTLDVYVGMQAGSLVKFTTTPYP